MTNETLPDSAMKKAANLVRDARLSVVAALIPVLGLLFILRLVQWYQLKRQYPALSSPTTPDQAILSHEFRSAVSRLWFAVLFWPVLIVLIYAYSFFG